VHARHNISLDHQHGVQFFDQVAAAVTPTKLTSECFIGNDYKDLITFMCSDERTVPIINVDPRQDLHRQGVMVGAALTMGHIYGGAMGAILAGTDAVLLGMARTAGERVRDYLVSAPRIAKDHTVLGIRVGPNRISSQLPVSDWSFWEPKTPFWSKPDLRVEFLLKTESGDLRDAEVT